MKRVISKSGVWFTSDPHFFHKNIIKYSNRPFEDIEDMTNNLIINWNYNVKPHDTVYMLGDIFFGRPGAFVDVMNALNGTKHLIYGNHDYEIKRSKELQSLFASTQDYKKIRVSDNTKPKGYQNIVLFHYAMRVWAGSHKGYYSLYGHSHGTLPEDPCLRSFDVGVDAIADYLYKEELEMNLNDDRDWEEFQSFYRPFSYEEVDERMKNKQWKPVDHHDEHTN